MTVIVWIVEGTWTACIDAATALAPADAEIVLLHVSGGEAPAAAHGAYAGLLGRGRPGRDPGRGRTRCGVGPGTAPRRPPGG